MVRNDLYLGHPATRSLAPWLNTMEVRDTLPLAFAPWFWWWLATSGSSPSFFLGALLIPINLGRFGNSQVRDFYKP
jgi:hypothetical protein